MDTIIKKVSIFGCFAKKAYFCTNFILDASHKKIFTVCRSRGAGRFVGADGGQSALPTARAEPVPAYPSVL